MREYDLEEILAEYAEKNLETAQPEEETAPPEEELTETADQLPDEEESLLPEENEEDVKDTYGAGSAEEAGEDPDAQLSRKRPRADRSTGTPETGGRPHRSRKKNRRKSGGKSRKKKASARSSDSGC